MIKNNGRLYRIVSSVLIVLGFAGVFVLGYFTRVWSAPDVSNEIEEIIALIEKNYDGEFDAREFIRAAVNGTLDKYSAYYSPQQADELELSRQGIIQGRTGLTFNTEDVTVYSVAGNSPAERAGIVEGGKVVGAKRADGERVNITKYRDLSDYFASVPADDEMTFIISYSDGEEEFTLKRENYTASYVWYQDATGAYFSTDKGNDWVMQKKQKPLKTRINGSYYDVKVPDGKAYIRLSSFYGSAGKQIRAALSTMKQHGITQLVLDLRANGGGYMDVLTDITGSLIPGGKKQLVSKAVYKNNSEYKFNTSHNDYDNYGYTAITILADSGTASASEALIGAVLDYDNPKYGGKGIVKVLVVDKSNGVYKTYGKGIMQTTFETSAGSAIKLTTARIYWPLSGVCIHDTGITPELDDRISGISILDEEENLLNSAFSR